MCLSNNDSYILFMQLLHYKEKKAERGKEISSGIAHSFKNTTLLYSYFENKKT